MALALVKSWYPEVRVDMLTGGFRVGMSLEGLRPEILMASGRIAKAVDLTQLVPDEPSSAVRPTEGVEAATLLPPLMPRFLDSLAPRDAGCICRTVNLA